MPISLLPLAFEDTRVRVELRDGQPWWLLADVCRILDISNPRKVAASLDDDEKEKIILGNEGVLISDGAKINDLGFGVGNNEVWIISEVGLYSLIMKSRKPEAKRFQKWVTSEVLPTIRRTGQYPAPAVQSQMPDDMRQTIGGIVKAVIGKAMTERDSFIQQLADEVRAMIVASDPRIAAVTHRPMLDVLIELKVPQKRRRALSQRCSRLLSRWCIANGHTDAIRISRETRRYLFDEKVIQPWLQAEGNAIIAAHRSAIEGQGVLRLVPRRNAPEPTPIQPA